MSKVTEFLDSLNAEYLSLHKKYEDLFWISYMGDHSVDDKKDKALERRDTFRSDSALAEKTKSYLSSANLKAKIRLNHWLTFFSRYQSVSTACIIKSKIDILESALLKKRSERKEGYIDPVSKKFVVASSGKMATMVRTHENEQIRKACFEARELLAIQFVDEYIEIVTLRNEYARELGYDDFYDFKVQREDGMTKTELFSLLDSIYEKTKYVFNDVRELEKSIPDLRSPWNFAYRMSGDFTKEEDQYYQFDQALERWGRSFSALGINFKGGTLTLDLLDRVGKWNNGFCHWPTLVHFEGNRRIAGTSNFTCNTVIDQVGSGAQGFHTLFHEGGHAAHFLNTEQKDVVMNHEYAPMSMSWAETQSIFCDTLFSSIEWKMRYAKNTQDESYPFSLFERKVQKTNILAPRSMHGVLFVSSYERDIYECKDLTHEKVIRIAKSNYGKFYDHSNDSLFALNVPHIYSWESSGTSHGYGLAELAVHQWRDYFYKKYGYIVDNKNVGKEMAAVWKLGATHTFKEFVTLATGSKLSTKSFLKNCTMKTTEVIKEAKKRVKYLESVKGYMKPVAVNAFIQMVHGKKKIADTNKSFEEMALKYQAWLVTLG